jgi:FPC/CPF motif-containing protein YcgG
VYFPTISEDSSGADSALIERFEAHIRDKAFPCVGAKSALSRQQMQFVVVGDIRCPRDDRTIYEGLRDFARAFKANPEPFQSFVVLFRTRDILPERAFEQVLFQRLQALEVLDAAAGETYDPRVSPDVHDPRFSLSFGGEAFFVVGLHPGASRPARQFEMPVLVFNAHDQFETLRQQGRYETLRTSIIDRDIKLSGTENPMLSRHGDSSEARQYSGRMVEADWQCPLRRVHAM